MIFMTIYLCIDVAPFDRDLRKCFIILDFPFFRVVLASSPPDPRSIMHPAVPPPSHIAPAPHSTPGPVMTPATAARSSTPAPTFAQTAPCTPSLAPQTVVMPTAPPSCVPNLPYPVKDTFLKNHHHFKTTSPLDLSNNGTPQGSLVHQQPPAQQDVSIAVHNATAPTKRTHDDIEIDPYSKKHC